MNDDQPRPCSETEGFCDQHGYHRTTPATNQSRPFPDVQGRCPACGWTSLFLADGGYITCSRLECPQPDAASTLLERDVRTNPATCDATAIIDGFFGTPSAFGPCILRAGHDGPGHKAANGAQWWPTETAAHTANPAQPEDDEDEALKASFLEAVAKGGHRVEILEPDPGAAAKTATRAELHDAIRYLARVDRTWWHEQLRAYDRIEYGGRMALTYRLPRGV